MQCKAIGAKRFCTAKIFIKKTVIYFVGVFQEMGLDTCKI
jgi:hypothetical protein